MSRILMCKNKEVFDIDNNIVINRLLLPGRMSKLACTETFEAWMKARYSCGTNTFSRMLKTKMFGMQGHREEINKQSYALSYTDCYWIKEKSEQKKFEDVSPYYTSFWDGEREYVNGEAIPTLYTPGALPKEWRKDGTLFKSGELLDKEIDCIHLCKLCDVSVEEGYRSLDEDKEGIILINFTSKDLMLEQANMSGLINEETFTSMDVERVFGVDGIKMLVIDAIIGNGDRHAGNFGFLRDANTGEYLGMSPLYDFDHALDSDITDRPDKLMQDLERFFEKKEYREAMKEIADKAVGSSHSIFSKRAQIILSMLEGFEIFLD